MARKKSPKTLTIRGREFSRYGLPLSKVRVTTKSKDYDGGTLYRQRIFNLKKMRFERR